MQPLLNIAVRAARRAGEVIVRSLDRVHRLDVRAKGRNDFVTRDRHAGRAGDHRDHPQALPGARLPRRGKRRGSGDGDEYIWIIDPLDGTTNFLHGFPQFAVSIGLQHRGRLEHAVVYDPLRQELFTASRGDGAQLDGRRMRVSKQHRARRRADRHGLSVSREPQWLDHYLAMLKAVMQATAGMRRPGAAALDLAYVAAGRLDAFWEIGLSPWDTAAGKLLITEAGGRVGTLTGARIQARAATSSPARRKCTRRCSNCSRRTCPRELRDAEPAARPALACSLLRLRLESRAVPHGPWSQYRTMLKQTCSRSKPIQDLAGRRRQAASWPNARAGRAHRARHRRHHRHRHLRADRHRRRQPCRPGDRPLVRDRRHRLRLRRPLLRRIRLDDAGLRQRLLLLVRDARRSASPGSSAGSWCSNTCSPRRPSRWAGRDTSSGCCDAAATSTSSPPALTNAPVDTRSTRASSRPAR